NQIDNINEGGKNTDRTGISTLDALSKSDLESGMRSTSIGNAQATEQLVKNGTLPSFDLIDDGSGSQSNSMKLAENSAKPKQTVDDNNVTFKRQGTKESFADWVAKLPDNLRNITDWNKVKELIESGEDAFMGGHITFKSADGSEGN